jgi:hypothetical protein
VFVNVAACVLYVVCFLHACSVLLHQTQYNAHSLPPPNPQPTLTKQTQQLFIVANPVMGIIFLGVKDSTLPAAAGKAYVSPEAFRSNIEAILDAGTKAGVRRWLVITPPPIIEPPDKKGARSTANTQKYVDALSSLARARGAAFLDIFSQWPKTAGWDARYFLPDKLHLSADGNARLFSDVMAAVRVRCFLGLGGGWACSLCGLLFVSATTRARDFTTTLSQTTTTTTHTTAQTTTDAPPGAAARHGPGHDGVAVPADGRDRPRGPRAGVCGDGVRVTAGLAVA